MTEPTSHSRTSTHRRRASNTWGRLLTTACVLSSAAILVLAMMAVTPTSRQAVTIASDIFPKGYVPVSMGSPFDPTPEPTATPTPEPTITPTPAPTQGAPLPPPTPVAAVPPIDFRAAREAAQAQGLDIAFVKVGFHVAVGGNQTGIGEYFKKLNDAGVPIFLKSADAGGPLYQVQELMKANAAAGRYIDHTLVFRLTDKKYEDPFYTYEVSPEQAARNSWALNVAGFPKELDPSIVWMETLNEPGRYGGDGDGNENLQIERLARFSLESAKLAVAQGRRYAALSWSLGVPEREDWEHPAMLEFLRFAGEHPDTVSVALHEYSEMTEFIARGYPYYVGRFQMLFDVCDEYGIPRPTIHITEWGWSHNSVPEPVPALEDIAWASWLYAAYPQVKGAALWYLGPGFGNIHNEAQRLIAPLADYAISHYFIIDPGQGAINPEIFRPAVPTWRGITAETVWPTPYPRPQPSLDPTPTP